jgi:hypothetical protein
MVAIAKSPTPDPRDGLPDLHAPICHDGTSLLARCALDTIRKEFPSAAPITFDQSQALWSRLIEGEQLPLDDSIHLRDFVRWVQALFDHELTAAGATSHWAYICAGCPELPVEPLFDGPEASLAERRAHYDGEVERWSRYERLSRLTAPFLKDFYSVEKA